jgi:glycine cleavage system protein P-like pyridoxal-binding family
VKITKDQYETAKRQVARLEKAQATVSRWEGAVKSVEDHMAGMDVVEVHIDANGKVSVRSVKIEEEPNVAGERKAG